MQVIIPLAGLGSRLRPHTHTTAKPLIEVAGKAVLGYILDELKKVNVSEIIFIIGYLGDQIKSYVHKNYNFKTKFLMQEELNGQAPAIKLAQRYVKEDVLIWFADTLSDADIKKLEKTKADGLIYVKEHEDPERFGIVFPNKKGFIEKIVEKPKNPPSNLANIGMYYVKDYKLLFECIDHLIKHDMQTKGEFYLVDAFNIMISKGFKFGIENVNVWEDCGNKETLLQTNRYLLNKMKPKRYQGVKNSVVINPVFIDEGVSINNSVIGPFVSISKEAKIENSLIKDSIIGKNAEISDAQLDDTLVGTKAKIKGSYKRLNVGDDSEIIIS